MVIRVERPAVATFPHLNCPLIKGTHDLSITSSTFFCCYKPTKLMGSHTFHVFPSRATVVILAMWSRGLICTETVCPVAVWTVGPQLVLSSETVSSCHVVLRKELWDRMFALIREGGAEEDEAVFSL